MGWANCAVGGAVSQQFFPYLQSLIGYINPAYVILPGWTANETMGGAKADTACCNQFFARLLQAADLVRLNGALPLWLTPFPRNCDFMIPERLAAWLALRQSILQLRHAGEIVIDATAVLGAVVEGEFDEPICPI